MDVLAFSTIADVPYTDEGPDGQTRPARPGMDHTILQFIFSSIYELKDFIFNLGTKVAYNLTHRPMQQRTGVAKCVFRVAHLWCAPSRSTINEASRACYEHI